MLGDLSGKTALVTGGASGLGRGICQVMADCGATIASADLDLTGAQRTAEAIEESGGKAKAFYVDVVDGESVKDLVDSVLSDFDSIDILVNGAGVIGAPGPDKRPAQLISYFLLTTGIQYSQR